MEFKKLCRIRDAYKEREQLKEKIYEFEQMRISPRAAVYGSERVQSSPKGDIQPDNIAKLDKLIAKYNSKLKAITELVYEFETALDSLDERERRLMRLYYIDCMTWEQVCVKMNLSWTPMHNARRSALAKICPDYEPNGKKSANIGSK